MKLKSFTMIEILITLGIIGIVAALTIPALVSKYNEKQTVNRITSIYSKLTMAYSVLLEQSGPPSYWGVQTDTGIMNKFATVLKISGICRITASACNKVYKRQYRDMKGLQSFNYYDGAVGQMLDGSTIWIRTGSYKCVGFDQYAWVKNNPNNPFYNACGSIDIDINGNTGPNRLGVDRFSFIYTESKIIPNGTIGEPYYNLGTSCNGTRSSGSWDGGVNGAFCAAWILKKKNMKYLKERIVW